MNSNWLSFPLSPNNSTYMQAPYPHQFSQGLVTDNMDNLFQNREWNLLNTHDRGEVPKVADFLGVSKSEDQSDLVAFNQIHANDSDYVLSSSSVVQVHDSLVVASNNYEAQENVNSLQSLTLSMSSSSARGSTSRNTSIKMVEAPAQRKTDTFGQRTSIYRGVTRHRWTGRYEAHLWDNSCRREGQSRKGRQVYLGGYDKEEKAARAYDLAALKYWGTSTTTNFPINNYEKELEEMKQMTRLEFVAAIRRKSSGFSRGASMYRGVTRHHQQGRWQARIGRVAGNKDLYLGTFSTEEEAAEAYDIAAIKFRGLNAVTNFVMSRYDVKSILESNSLPIGAGAAKRLKESQAVESSRKRKDMIAIGSSPSRVQAYSLMQSSSYQPQPIITLQNHDISHYNQDVTSFHQNYLHLHQQSSPQFCNGYIQNNSVLFHGLLNMGSSSSTVENNGSSSGSYSVGYWGNGCGIGVNSAGSNAVGSAEQLAHIKLDYDMPSGGYANWYQDSIQGSNSSVFTMWND